MAWVVFMRAVNVGGHGTFQPSVLAQELADIGVASIGAAGTFVVRSAISQTSVRARIQDELPFKAQMMICPARELIDLASRDPFPKGAPDKATRRFLSVMEKSPRTSPHLPFCRPPGDLWEVKVVGVAGRYVMSLCRRQGPKILYPNEVVEKQFEMAATTRNWNTISSIGEILKESQAPSLRVDQGRRPRRGLDRD